MAKTFSLTIDSNDDNQPFVNGAKEISLFNLINILRAIVGGAKSGAVTLTARNDLVHASGTVTCATPLANDTVTVGGIVFTAKVSGAVGDQFNIGADDTATAANLAAAINASATVGAANAYTVTSALGVVTIKTRGAGPGGNAVTLASSNGGRLAVSGARLSGGADTRYVFTF